MATTRCANSVITYLVRVTDSTTDSRNHAEARLSPRHDWFEIDDSHPLLGYSLIGSLDHLIPAVEEYARVETELTKTFLAAASGIDRQEINEMCDDIHEIVLSRAKKRLDEHFKNIIAGDEGGRIEKFAGTILTSIGYEKTGNQKWELPKPDGGYGAQKA